MVHADLNWFGRTCWKKDRNQKTQLNRVLVRKMVGSGGRFEEIRSPPVDEPGRRLSDRVTVVIGGATGFGRTTSALFTAHGARVVVAGRRADLAAAAGREFGGWGTGCDVVDDEQVRQLVDAVVEREGTVDVVVNYAGYQESTPIRELTPNHVGPMVEVQLVAAMQVVQHFGNAMAATGGGSIISTSSLTAHNPTTGHPVYAACKRGLEYFTEIAALEYGPDGVRVNCVAAHLIETPMTTEIFQNRLAIEAVVSQTPLGHMGTVDDIANAALFLACDESAYVSGHTLLVDGAASTQKLPTARDLELLANARPDLLKEMPEGGKA